jgi:hypothetical protein
VSAGAEDLPATGNTMDHYERELERLRRDRLDGAGLLTAVLLGLAAAAAARFAAGLALDAWVLWASAAILVAATAGVLLKQRWAWLFALLLFLPMALALTGGGVVLLWDAVTSHNGDGWAWLRHVLQGVFSIVAMVVGALLGAACWGLTRTRLRGTVAGTLAAGLGALLLVGALAWLVGDRFVRQELYRQSACVTGQRMACTNVVGNELLSDDRRRHLASIGCEGDEPTACKQLVRLAQGQAPDSRVVQVLDKRCQGGDVHLCVDLARTRLSDGDEAAIRHLRSACTARPSQCLPAATVAFDAGKRQLAEALLDDGCGRDDPDSCRHILRERRHLLDTAAVTALSERVCLLGGINDCMALINADLAGTCGRICEGASDARVHACMRCASIAGERKRPELQRAWAIAACDSGRSWGCEALKRLAPAPPPSTPLLTPALTPPSRAGNGTNARDDGAPGAPAVLVPQR